MFSPTFTTLPHTRFYLRPHVRVTPYDPPLLLNHHPEYLDAVRIAQIVEDPAEEVNVLAFDRLAGEEIVSGELDAGLVFFKHHLGPLLRRTGQILHDEAHVLGRIRQMLRHPAVPSAYIYQDCIGAVEGRPVVIGGQVLDIERLTFGHELHALTEASSALGLVGEEGVQGEVGAVADAVCHLVGFARVWEAGQCLGHLYEGGLYFAGPLTDVVEKLGVLDHHAADGRVSDAAGRGFGEDAVGHCMAEEAKDEGLEQAARLGDFGIGSGAIEGYGFVDVIGVDDVQDGDVGGLPLFHRSFQRFVDRSGGAGGHSRCAISRLQGLWGPIRVFEWFGRH